MPPTHGNGNRTVHAAYKDMEIVRYDRAGKWYLEPTIRGLARQQVKVSVAAKQAVWCEDNADGVVYLGRPGGGAFDRLVRAWREHVDSGEKLRA